MTDYKTDWVHIKSVGFEKPRLVYGYGMTKFKPLMVLSEDNWDNDSGTWDDASFKWDKE
jgi:hypothetical protein